MEKKESSEGSTLAIGIDLGTTNSCVAVWERDCVEIIASDEGLRTTPSYVSFTDEEKLVGNVALEYAARDPTNAIFAVKRFIGLRSSDPCVKKDMELFPVAVVSSKEDKPKFVVQFKGEKKHFSAEEISSMILTKMKQIAEKYHGRTVKDAVITVPANFSDSQRRATKEAGVLAGLNVMRLMDEPSAAALAYCFKKIPEYTTPQNVFVFDLGGGTFDASLVNICGGHFQIKATAGDTHLGGEDFVNRILMHAVMELKREHQKDILDNPKALRRLKYACESAKKSLSAVGMATVHVDYLYPDLSTFSSKLSRIKFEELNNDLFEKCIELTKQCLKDAKVDKSDVDIVVLVGGSSRIPKLQKILEEYFGENKIHSNINPDEAVAYGAAIMAAKLIGQGNESINNIVLTDVTPLSFGTDVLGGVMSIVIPRNTPIPTKKVCTRRTGKDNRTEMTIRVYEGERTKASSNNLLGKLTVSGISPAPRGEQHVDVCFEVDADGILNVSATVQGTGQITSKLQITYEESWMRKETIDKMMNDAEKSKAEDEELKRKYDALKKVESYTINTRRTMRTQEVESLISECDRKKIEDKISEAFRWLDLNHKPFASVEASRSKLRELKEVCEPIIAKMK